MAVDIPVHQLQAYSHHLREAMSATFDDVLSESPEIEERNQLLKAVLHLPLGEQIKHLRVPKNFDIEAAKDGNFSAIDEGDCRYLLESTGQRKVLDELSLGSQGADGSTENPTQAEIRTSSIKAINNPSELRFHESYANRIVLVDDGEARGAALMLSQELCDLILDSLKGNRETYFQAKQRDTNVTAFDQRIEAIDSFNAQLESRYKDVQEMAVSEPGRSHVEALLSIAHRQERLLQAREEVISMDQQEAEDMDVKRKDQLNRSWQMCSALDDTFVAERMQSELELPDFESQKPELDTDIFEDLSIDETLGIQSWF